MSGKCVVKAAADIDSESVFQCAARREDRSDRGEPKSLDCRLGVRNLQPHALAEAELVVPAFVHPFTRMYSQDILVCRRLRSENVGGCGDVISQEQVANHPEFLRLEDVLAQTQVVAFVIDQLEREHDCCGTSCRDRG